VPWLGHNGIRASVFFDVEGADGKKTAIIIIGSHHRSLLRFPSVAYDIKYAELAAASLLGNDITQDMLDAWGELISGHNLTPEDYAEIHSQW
jgi:hypothetical protein